MHKTSLSGAQFCGKVKRVTAEGGVGEVVEGAPSPEVGVSLMCLRTREKATFCGCCPVRQDSGRRYCRKIWEGWGAQPG